MLRRPHPHPITTQNFLCKNSGGDDHHHREGDSCGGGGGGASGAGVTEGAAEGETLLQQPGQLAAALAEATEGGGISREWTFRVGRLVNLLPLVFVFEHGPQRDGRGSRQEVSKTIE